jgi:hypothetical protein
MAASRHPSHAAALKKRVSQKFNRVLCATGARIPARKLREGVTPNGCRPFSRKRRRRFTVADLRTALLLLCRTHVLLIASCVLPRSARCRKLPPTLQRNHSSPAISLHRPRMPGMPFRYALPSWGWRDARKGNVLTRSSGSTFPRRLNATVRLLRGRPFGPHLISV